MSEEKQYNSDNKEQTLCSTADIDIYVKNKFYNNISLLEGILNNFKNINCANPILKKLINNTIKHIKQPTNILQPIIKLEGSSSIINLYSKKYDKYIVLLGDVHQPFVSSQNSISITQYFQTYFQNNTKLIDFFIEIPFYHKTSQDFIFKVSPLRETYERFKNCYTDKNCSFRFHATDIRMGVGDTITKITTDIQYIFQLLEYLELNYVWDIEIIKVFLQNSIFKNFCKLLRLNTFHGHTIVKQRIEKQIDNIFDIDIKNILISKFNTIYTEENIKQLEEFFNDFLDKISTMISTPNEKEHKEFTEKFNKLITPFNEYHILLLDIYTLSRVFRNFLPYRLNSTSEKIEYYNPSPKYNIIFLGQTHIDNIYDILVNDLQFDVIFGQKRTIRRSFDIQYQNLPHKFFNDKDFIMFTKKVDILSDDDIYED